MKIFSQKSWQEYNQELDKHYRWLRITGYLAFGLGIIGGFFLAQGIRGER